MIDLVIFDLDGTLVESHLDFDEIRREIGNVSGPILEYMDHAEEAERDRIYEEYIDKVGTLASGVVQQIDKGNLIINLGRGEPVQMGRFVRVVEGLTGREARFTSSPAPPSEPPITYADITKARTLLGYDPLTPVTDGMRQFWAWYQAEGHH